MDKNFFIEEVKEVIRKDIESRKTAFSSKEKFLEKCEEELERIFRRIFSIREQMDVTEQVQNFLENSMLFYGDDAFSEITGGFLQKVKWEIASPFSVDDFGVKETSFRFFEEDNSSIFLFGKIWLDIYLEKGDEEEISIFNSDTLFSAIKSLEHFYENSREHCDVIYFILKNVLTDGYFEKIQKEILEADKSAKNQLIEYLKSKNPNFELKNLVFTGDSFEESLRFSVPEYFNLDTKEKMLLCNEKIKVIEDRFKEIERKAINRKEIIGLLVDNEYISRDEADEIFGRNKALFMKTWAINSTENKEHSNVLVGNVSAIEIGTISDVRNGIEGIIPRFNFKVYLDNIRPTRERWDRALYLLDKRLKELISSNYVVFEQMYHFLKLKTEEYLNMVEEQIIESDKEFEKLVRDILQKKKAE